MEVKFAIYRWGTYKIISNSKLTFFFTIVSSRKVTDLDSIAGAVGAAELYGAIKYNTIFLSCYRPAFISYFFLT